MRTYVVIAKLRCPSLTPHKPYGESAKFWRLPAYNPDLDNWLWHYNNERTHQAKMCCGRTPMATLLDGKRLWAEKNLNQS